MSHVPDGSWVIGGSVFGLDSFTSGKSKASSLCAVAKAVGGRTADDRPQETSSLLSDSYSSMCVILNTSEPFIKKSKVNLRF